MEDMTPEERYRRIENFMNMAAEYHAKHSEMLARHDAAIEKHDAMIERQNAGIRDLIVVSRTVLTSIQELREAQAVTDEKLHILIDTVDRIIRNQKN